MDRNNSVRVCQNLWVSPGWVYAIDSEDKAESSVLNLMCKFNICLRKLPRTNTCILLFSFSSKKYVGRQIKIKAGFKRSSMNSNALFDCVSFSKHTTYTTIFWFEEYQNTYNTSEGYLIVKNYFILFVSFYTLLISVSVSAHE